MEAAISNPLSVEDEQKVIVKFLTLSNEKSPKKIYRRLAYVYKKNVVSLNKVIKWWKSAKGLDDVTNEKIPVKLNFTKEPWRRTNKLDELEVQPKDNLLKQIQGTLNKLSEKNIIIHQKYMLSLPIDTEQSLRAVVRVILSHVSVEHKYANLYASLCKFLSGKYVPYEKQIIGACPMNITFGEVLSSSCIEDLNLKLEEIKNVPYESSKILRYKIKGLNIFMAEIYKLNLISPHILHEYLQLLLDEKNKKNLYTIESFCICLTKVGKYLEDQSKEVPPLTQKQDIDDYFRRIKSFSKDEPKKLPYRIYFMLLDLIELGTERNWVPRFPKVIKTNFVRKFRYRKFNFDKISDNTNETGRGENKSRKKKKKKKVVQAEEKTNILGPSVNLKVTIIKRQLGEKAEEEKLLWKLLSTMNKMTDCNINTLLLHLNDLPVEKYLNKVVDIITDKAIKEPLFCHLYANLCWYISTVIVKDQNQEVTQVPAKLVCTPFRQVLLNKCRSMWHEKVCQNLQLEWNKLEEESLFKYKLMSKGLAKFISELYKVGILSRENIYYFLDSITLEANQPLLNIELLCVFLTYIGQYLQKESKDNVEKYFSYVKLLYEKTPRYPYRIWFQLLDLIELYNRNWLSKKPSVIVTTKKRDTRLKNKTNKTRNQSYNKQECGKENNVYSNHRKQKICRSNTITEVNNTQGLSNSITAENTDHTKDSVMVDCTVAACSAVDTGSNRKSTYVDNNSLVTSATSKESYSLKASENDCINQNKSIMESKLPEASENDGINQNKSIMESKLPDLNKIDKADGSSTNSDSKDEINHSEN